MDCSVIGGTNGTAMILLGAGPEPILAALRRYGLVAEAKLYDYIFKGTLWLYFIFCDRRPTETLGVSKHALVAAVRQRARLLRTCSRRLLDNKLNPVPSWMAATWWASRWF